MNRAASVFRALGRVPDMVAAVLVTGALVLIGVPWFLMRGRALTVPSRPRLLYVGYTTLDQAQEKGLLRSEGDANRTYNPASVLKAVSVFVPIGKRAHITKIASDITFIEHAEAPWRAFPLTQKALRIAKGCLDARRLALEHDVVMVGGPHVASLPGLFVRLTTPVRVVLFIEAFWEDILPMQAYMSRVEKAFWRRWYALLYRVFDGFVGGPSFKPGFYVERGMRRDRIWPYIHQINAAGLEQESEEAVLPANLCNLAAPLVICIGRLEKEKLSADCVAMAARLAAIGTNFRLVIVGEGSQRAALEAEIARTGLQDVVLMIGAQPNAVTYKIARQAVACFAPYMGTALVEVLLAGCALVAYDNDPHRGIAGDGPVIFVPHGDTVAGAEALAALLADPIGLEARREATRKYAWDKWNERAIGEAYAAPLLGRGGSFGRARTG